ncbi:MAG: hypothetical protein AAGA43_14310, partial [Bacteroidota bacterium]
MKNVVLLLVLSLFLGTSSYGQIKIGENPENLDASSVLELESSTRVLVITRVTNVQMLSITPLRGAMVYNTDTQCVHFYTGTEWFNPCATEGQTFSADANINPDATIIITETVTSDPQSTNFNFEVGVINGVRNIAPSTIIGDFHITPNSIQSLQLGNDSVTLDKLADGVIDGQLIQWNGTEWELIEETAITVTELDGVVGNEITNVADATLIRTGGGVDGDPFLVDVNAQGIGTNELADNAVTNIKINNDAITSDKILDGEVNTADIADNAITNIKLDDDSVGTNEIIDDGVTRDDINANVAGTGLIQALDGSLEVDPSTITGDGDISSPDGTIDITGTATDALFEDIDIDVADNAITLDKIGTLGAADANSVLTTDGAGDPQWEDRTNFATSTLNDGLVFVGSAANVATGVAISGDATIDNTGAI